MRRLYKLAIPGPRDCQVRTTVGTLTDYLRLGQDPNPE